jgi:hypothetical protein
MVSLVVWVACGAFGPAEYEKQAGKNFAEVCVGGWSMMESLSRRLDG